MEVDERRRKHGREGDMGERKGETGVGETLGGVRRIDRSGREGEKGWVSEADESVREGETQKWE